jgi:hypothetical protein
MEQLPILARPVNHSPDEDIFTKSAETLRSLRTNWEAEIIAVQLSALSETRHYEMVAVQDDSTLDLINGRRFPDVSVAWDFEHLRFASNVLMRTQASYLFFMADLSNPFALRVSDLGKKGPGRTLPNVKIESC